VALYPSTCRDPLRALRADRERVLVALIALCLAWERGRALRRAARSSR